MNEWVIHVLDTVRVLANTIRKSKWVHITLPHVAQTNELRMSYEWGASELRIHVMWLSEPCSTYKWVTNEVRMSYEWVTNELRMYVIWLSEPCSTYTWVTYELRITMSYEWVTSCVRIHVIWLICDVTDLYVESFICYTCDMTPCDSM